MKDSTRATLVKRGRILAWFTITWNVVEGLVSIGSGFAAGSIALIGFGIDSYVEVFAGTVVLWRLSKETQGKGVSEETERKATRLIAVTFFLLAIGIAAESTRRLITGERPEESLIGIAITVVSLIVMPVLARSKMRVGRGLNSQTLKADATETMLCVWLSVIVLAGLLLNAGFGWWWADPVAGYGIVYYAFKEGLENWRGEDDHDNHH